MRRPWILLFLATGCAHYSLPGVRLESPEASGRVAQFELEPLALVTGTNLVEKPTLTYPDPAVGGAPTPNAQGSVKPAIGALVGVSPRFDAGLRFSPHSPLQLRLKYQFTGEPEELAAAGNISGSLVVSPGFMVGRDGKNDTSYFIADFSLPFGYRLNSHHLFSVVPFYTMASLSGLSATAADSATGPAAAVAAAGKAISPSQLGAGLGYQLSIQYLFLRTEISDVLSGSVGDTQIGGIKFGLLLGLELK